MESWRLILWTIVLNFLGSTLWGAPLARYDIRAEMDLKRKTISGAETVVVNNPSTVPLREIHLFLFPNAYRTKNPNLNEMNYRWHHPSGFDGGWLEVSAVENASSGESLQGETVDRPGLPAQTVFRIGLPEPLAPGAELSLKVSFECKVPYKYGPFGHYRETVTAQGGWHPYLVPVRADGEPQFDASPAEGSFQVRLRLSARRDAVVNGQFYDDVTEVDYSSEASRYLTLVVTPQFYVRSEPAGSRKVTYYRIKENRYALDRVMESFAAGVIDAGTFAGAGSPEEVVVVDSYLRAVMTHPGENMILLSDRFFLTESKFDFRNLNRLEIARAISFALLSHQVAEREDPADYRWVAEAMAWAFRNQFLRTHFETLSSLRETAGRMGMFRPFNRMAASPTIPFSETYAGSTTLRDPFRESLLYFNNGFLSGQVFAENLLDTVGEEAYERIVRGYLFQSQDFQSFVSEVLGKDMGWFFKQWKEGYPPDLDYRLTDVHRNQKTDGGYLTRFTVERRAARPFVGPVQVRVHNEGDEASTLLWNGEGSAKTFEIKSESKVTLIELDPKNRTVQTEIYNDLAPHRWEYIMDRGDVDVSSGGLGAGMRIRMHKARDQSKFLFVLPFFSPAEVGAEAGMLFDFGGIVDGLVWNRKQELSLSYAFTDLRGGFADPASGRIDGVGRASELKLRYTFQNKMFEEDPMDFESVELAGSLSREELGSDFNFFSFSLTGGKVFAVHPKHKLAAAALLGYSDGFRSQDEIPAQKLFDLSSTQFMGFAEAGRFLGEKTFQTSVEWRHDLMSDLDMSMPMNMRIRRLQGALAVGAAWFAKEFDDLFDINETVWGIRYGLRFFYDFLGVRPSNFTVDVGYRIGDGLGAAGKRFVFGFGILQSF